MAVRAVTGGETRGGAAHGPETPALRVVAAEPVAAEPMAAPPVLEAPRLETAAPVEAAPAVAEPVGPARRAGVPWGLYWAHVLGVFGLALSNGLLGLAVLTAPLAGGWRRLLARDVRPLLLAALAYLLLLGGSIATSFDPRHSLAESSELFAMCTLVLGVVLARGERRVRQVVDAVVLLATLEALVGIGQLVARGGADLSRRIEGTLSHYMTFAAVLMLGDLLLCAQVAVRGRRVGWRAVALLPINVALMATLTRSAWVGLAAGLVVLLLLSRRRALLWAVPALLAIGLLLPQGVKQRMASIVDPYDTTNSDRLAMARAGAEMIAERPLLGQGPGMVEERYPLYRLPEAWRKTVPHLHNGYLQIAAERGLPALVALIALLALPLRRALRGLRADATRSGPRADLYLGIVAALVGFAVAALFEDSWGDTEVQRHTLALMALPFGLGEVEGTTTGESDAGS